MTTRRQDSVETWGNDLKKRRCQGDVTEKEKMTIGKQRCLISVRHASLVDRKKNSKGKRTPTGVPSYIRKRPASLYQAGHLS